MTNLPVKRAQKELWSAPKLRVTLLITVSVGYAMCNKMVMRWDVNGHRWQCRQEVIKWDWSAKKWADREDLSIFPLLYRVCEWVQRVLWVLLAYCTLPSLSPPPLPFNPLYSLNLHWSLPSSASVLLLSRRTHQLVHSTHYSLLPSFSLVPLLLLLFILLFFPSVSLPFVL